MFELSSLKISDSSYFVMKNGKISLLFIIALIAMVSVMSINATTRTQTTKSNDEKEQKEQKPTSNFTPEIPSSITFAGEAIDLTQQDRRERMDREMLSFCYSHINTMLQIKRANRLFPLIEPILKEQGIPSDFKYLMIIECNGDVEARSTAGAAGPWQFLEKTGKEYGLEVNGEVDERYNIEKATVAACKYLKESYEEFGDWLTVAASYNTGKANVRKRVTAQKENKAIDLVLLPETSRYIFRLLAVKTVFSNPPKYGFMLKESDLYPIIPIAKTITIDGAVASWADVAKEHGLTYLQLHEANPWIRNTSMTNKNGNRYNIKIPDVKALKYEPSNTKAHNRYWIAE